MSKPSLGHGEFVSWLTLKVGGYIINNNLGRISSGDAGFILERNPDGRDTVRGIDFAFISRAKSPGPLEFKLTDIAPDLAVEVISPSNEASDIHFKVLQLLNAGTAQVWIVYPDSRTIVVHGESGAYTLREDDTLSGGEILPGFEIPRRRAVPQLNGFWYPSVPEIWAIYLRHFQFHILGGETSMWRVFSGTNRILSQISSGT